MGWLCVAAFVLVVSWIAYLFNDPAHIQGLYGHTHPITQHDTKIYLSETEFAFYRLMPVPFLAPLVGAALLLRNKR